MGKVKRSLDSSRKVDVTVSLVELVLAPAWRDSTHSSGLGC